MKNKLKLKVISFIEYIIKDLIFIKRWLRVGTYIARPITKERYENFDITEQDLYNMSYLNKIHVIIEHPDEKDIGIKKFICKSK